MESPITITCRVRARLGTVVCLVFAGWGSAGSADDWPQFLGPTRDGRSARNEPVIAWGAEGPRIAWRRPVGQGYSGPVVAGAYVVLFHQSEAEEVLECLAFETGKKLWTAGYPCAYQGGYGTGPGPRATPSIVDGQVYSYGVTGVLQSVQLASGKVNWRRDLGKEFAPPEGFFGIGSSPVVDGDLILVNLGAKPNAGLAAFARATGETAWSSANELASYSSPIVADLACGRRALFFARGGLHSVEPRTGKSDFFFPFRARMNASVNAATPIVSGSRVFLTSSYGVGAALLEVDKAGAYRKVWGDTDTLSSQYNTPVLWRGTLFGIDGREDIGVARLVALEAATGRLYWAEENFGCAAIILVGDQLLIWKQNGELVLADATLDRFRPTAKAAILEAPCRAQPALAGGSFLVRNEGELVRVELGRQNRNRNGAPDARSR